MAFAEEKLEVCRTDPQDQLSPLILVEKLLSPQEAFASSSHLGRYMETGVRFGDFRKDVGGVESLERSSGSIVVFHQVAPAGPRKYSWSAGVSWDSSMSLICLRSPSSS